jgi:3'(2'), 5'-bisphosphate nucleotidase
MAFERELREALIAARLAGDYARREYETFVPIPNAPASISTHVDHGAQELILSHLRAAFPDDGLVAEERTPTLAGSPTGADRVWVVDPIDGTRGFAMKNGEFSVMVGLTVGGRPVVGVVLEPVSGRVTYAAAGSGCWVVTEGGEPRSCRVSAQVNLVESTLAQSWSKPGKPPKPAVTALHPARVVETYSAGLKLAIVARGEAELYVNDYANFHDWDVCAGHVLVEEAGGRVTLFDGSPVTYGGTGSRQRRGMIASNGQVHDEAVKKLAAL